MNLMNESVDIDEITLTNDACNGVDNGAVNVALQQKRGLGQATIRLRKIRHWSWHARMGASVRLQGLIETWTRIESILLSTINAM